MDPDVRHLFARGQRDERHEVPVVRVHTAGAHEADHVQRPATLASASCGLEQRRTLREAAVRDRRVDPGEVLQHGPSGAEVQVPDLGVAHLPRRQPNRILRRPKDGVRPAGQEAAPDRHVRRGHGIRGRV